MSSVKLIVFVFTTSLVYSIVISLHLQSSDFVIFSLNNFIFILIWDWHFAGTTRPFSFQMSSVYITELKQLLGSSN